MRRSPVLRGRVDDASLLKTRESDSMDRLTNLRTIYAETQYARQFTVLLEPWLGSSHANPGCRGRTVFDSENSALRE